MKRNKTIMNAGLIIFGIALVSVIVFNLGNLDIVGKKAYAEATNFEKFEGVSQTDSGEVIVILEPIDYSDAELTFRIRLDTHTVNNLHTYNLKKIVVLEANGEKIFPYSVPRLGGHHNSGNIVFKINTLPEKFKIKISNLNRPGERVFSWH